MRSVPMFFALWLLPAALLAANESGRIVVRDREDLFPKTVTVAIALPVGADWKDGSVSVDPAAAVLRSRK